MKQKEPQQLLDRESLKKRRCQM